VQATVAAAAGVTAAGVAARPNAGRSGAVHDDDAPAGPGKV
jgi:hypothetical protein